MGLPAQIANGAAAAPFAEWLQSGRNQVATKKKTKIKKKIQKTVTKLEGLGYLGSAPKENRTVLLLERELQSIDA